MTVERGTRHGGPEAGKTVVCFAMEDEARAFRKLVVGRDDVSILVTGIGRANAEGVFVGSLRICVPRLVLTCGFAGGLNPELKLGEVVFENSDLDLCQRLTTAGARPAKFYCASRIATTTAEKQDLRRVTGADGVEMESAAIHAVCREGRIPCATVRVISDTAQEDLPLDFNQLVNADQSLNYRRLALAVAKSPWKIPALLRLQRNSRLAAERLAVVLAKVCT